MLHRVLSGKILYYSNIIREAMEKIIPGWNDHQMRRMFKNLLLDEYQLWVYLGEGEEFKALGITVVENDLFTNGKALTIIAMYAPDGVKLEDFETIREAIAPFAKKHQCTKLAFFTQKDNMKRIASHFKPEVEATYYQINF